MSNFLVEIGCEEIPDWMIVPALQSLRELFDGIGVGKVSRVDATPRRLVLWADGLLDRQSDSEELVMGPPKSAGAGAANGFAKKMGVTPDQLGTESTPKGDYFSFVRKTAGRPTADILAEELPKIIGKIQWPKTMYWTIPGGPLKGGPRFIRPIRWIVALLGDAVVPFSYGDVRSGNVSQGHRILGSKAIPVAIATYEQQLKQNFVIVSATERRARILAAVEGKHVKADDKLLDTLTYITEFPTAIEGGFDPEYLKLPKEVLVMVMRHHQKYFSVEDGSGELAPRFIAIMNTDGDPEGLVRKGNEAVLRARFNDARFFWNVDQGKKLADRVEDLKAVTFQRDLGSYYEKTKRVVALVKEIGGDEHAQRAALLSKCDLTTEMVKEFTDLQGIVGGLYAKQQNEPEQVWKSIYQHYQPLSSKADDKPPEVGFEHLAIADKVDTLRSFFSIGLVPKGAGDPFALRRAAQGVIRILAWRKLKISIPALCGGDLALQDFFADRIRYYFRYSHETLYAYDEINAVMAAGYADVRDVRKTLEALHAIRSTNDFDAVAASCKRIHNILEQATYTGGHGLSEESFNLQVEKDLFRELQRVTESAQTHIPKQERLQFFQTIAETRPIVDRFFEQVMVMDPDLAVRTRRLELLYRIDRQFNAIADFSEIVTSKEG